MDADVFPVFTREEAIEEFRKMWKWMAKVTEIGHRKVHKAEYLEHIGVKPYKISRQCFLCEYVESELDGLNPDEYENSCDLCPIDFECIEGTADCFCCCDGSPYERWEETLSSDWENAAAFARMVAELPEKEVVEC